jgi:LmbE family N-acetylglucosaminyl deacetylase
MATIVSFHAHPDDEAIATGGTIAKAAAEGHRAVLVVATRGERGEVSDGFLDPGETLAARRQAETLAAAEVLGVKRVEFLGYVDSGMADTESNADPQSFCNAPVDQAAARLAKILDEESADVLTSYDANGGYGHPDHIQVHHVGLLAAKIAGVQRVFEATMNRDHFQRLVRFAREQQWDYFGEIPDEDGFDGIGMSEAELAAAIDVGDYLDIKRAAMAAHASQISDTSIFLALPEPAFSMTWGTEWYARPGATPAAMEDTLFGPREPSGIS